MFYLKHDLNPVEENSTCTTGAVIFDNKGCSTSGGHYNGNKWKDHWQVTESCYHKVIEFGSIIDKKVHVVVTCNRCKGTGQTSEWMGKEQVFLPDGRNVKVLVSLRKMLLSLDRLQKTTNKQEEMKKQESNKKNMRLGQKKLLKENTITLLFVGQMT